MTTTVKMHSKSVSSRLRKVVNYYETVIKEQLDALNKQRKEVINTLYSIDGTMRNEAAHMSWRKFFVLEIYKINRIIQMCDSSADGMISVDAEMHEFIEGFTINALNDRVKICADIIKKLHERLKEQREDEERRRETVKNKLATDPIKAIFIESKPSEPSNAPSPLVLIAMAFVVLIMAALFYA